MQHATVLNRDVQECIENCQNCHAVCLETIQHCLERGGDHASSDLVRLLLNCAEICATSAHFMLTGSDFHPRMCGLCAEICEACESSCRSVDPRDEQMKICADACRRCADSCFKMAGSHPETLAA